MGGSGDSFEAAVEREVVTNRILPAGTLASAEVGLRSGDCSVDVAQTHHATP